MKASPETIEALRILHAQYVRILEDSNITPLSLKVYKSNSENFVRWVEGTFIPGQKKVKNGSKS